MRPSANQYFLTSLIIVAIEILFPPLDDDIGVLFNGSLYTFQVLHLDVMRFIELKLITHKIEFGITVFASHVT